MPAGEGIVLVRDGKHRQQSIFEKVRIEMPNFKDAFALPKDAVRLARPLGTIVLTGLSTNILLYGRCFSDYELMMQR